jgi:hypothetical protein
MPVILTTPDEVEKWMKAVKEAPQPGRRRDHRGRRRAGGFQ